MAVGTWICTREEQEIHALLRPGLLLRDAVAATGGRLDTPAGWPVGRRILVVGRGSPCQSWFELHLDESERLTRADAILQPVSRN
jgi:hypothetical protein